MASSSKSFVTEVECPTPKSPKGECKYQLNWQLSGISPSKKGNCYAFCDTCKCDFSASHGGSNDVKSILILQSIYKINGEDCEGKSMSNNTSKTVPPSKKQSLKLRFCL